MSTLNQGHVVRKTVAAAHGGLTALDCLVRSFRHADAATWLERLDQVRLDGEPVRAGDRVRAGQELSWARPPWREPEAPLYFQILFEDEHLLAVSKPSGLPTLPGADYSEHTLLRLVRARSPEASPMHRLGRATSGLVLFGLTPLARRQIQAQWREPGAVRKVYRALVQGHPPWEQTTAEAPIGPVKDPVLGTLYAASTRGKPSASHLRVLERRIRHTLVQVRIDTGRPHQIRIHTAWLGHPLVGDPLYGHGGGRAAESQALPGDPGYHLHAHRLELRHPTHGEALCLEAPLPARLQGALEARTPPNLCLPR